MLTAEKVLEKRAIRFLKEQAPVAFFAFALAAGVVGWILLSDGVSGALPWMLAVLLLHTISLALRWFNEELFGADSIRLRFGMVANCLEACTAGSSLLFLLQVAPGVGVFMSMILLVESTGSALTSAGYKPLLWSFAGPLVAFQVFALAFGFFSTGAIVYAGAAIISMSSIVLIDRFAAHSRGLILSVVNAQLAAERASLSKTRFFSTSSHDLRQPVAASAAFVSSALAVCGDAVREKLEKAEDAIKMIDDQIVSILELARIDADEIVVSETEVDLNQLVKTSVKLFESRLSPTMKMQFRGAEDRVICHTDRQILSRVISNILDNSIKYTKDGCIVVQITPGPGEITLTIQDTGVGIETQELELVFDEFYQSHPSRSTGAGYGLGLPIARRLCTKLGIGLSLESEIGVGTTVELVIPERRTEPTIHA